MFKYLDELQRSKKEYEKIAIGYFDGVHKGHQKILRQLSNNDLIITFINNLHANDIYPAEEKILLLKEYCPNIIVLDLNKIKKDSKLKFIEFLKQFHPELVITGPDFRFGYKRQGSVADLEKHFNVKTVSFVKKNNEKISSSQIRDYLQEGHVRLANELLTRPFSITDMVVTGSGIGHRLGVPTVNFLIHNNVLLRKGVYETRVIYKGKKYKSVTNVGSRPTFNGVGNNIETHIIGFNKKIYGELITVEFIKYLREEKKFDSESKLVTQIKRDIKQVESKKSKI